MDLRRMRGPIVAGISTLLLVGAATAALATKPSGPPASAGATAEEPTSSGPDTDLLQVGDQSGAKDAAKAAGAPEAPEADAGKPDTDNVQDQSGAQDQSGGPD